MEQSFKELDVTTDTEAHGLPLENPVIVGLQHNLSAIIGIEFVRSESELAGIPFSLSAGAIDGESRLSVGIDWER